MTSLEKETHLQTHQFWDSMLILQGDFPISYLQMVIFQAIFVDHPRVQQLEVWIFLAELLLRMFVEGRKFVTDVANWWLAKKQNSGWFEFFSFLWVFGVFESCNLDGFFEWWLQWKKQEVQEK